MSLLEHPLILHRKNKKSALFIDKADFFAKDLQTKLRYPYKTKSWIDMNKNLFSALKTL